MANQETPERQSKTRRKTGFWQRLWSRFTSWTVRTHFWQRLFIGLGVTLVLVIGGMYGLAQWYISKNKNTPLDVGVTFIPNYARQYDLDPQQTLDAIINELGVKRLRLVSYWSDIEKQQGTYNFDELDWQIRMAEEHGVHVSLGIGLRQPRWPECHMPSWAQELQGQDWYAPLYDFISATVERYKDSPALQSYQLENEYFLRGFGICHDFNRDRLVHEYNLVKQIDNNTPIVTTMSNNAIGMPIGEPTPDMWAISVYKRIWNPNTQRYFEYPIPAWYYAFRAGFTELMRDRPVFVHELQAEPWTPPAYGNTKNTPLDEQFKSMNAERLRTRIDYGRATGMRAIDLWGAEWWYWLKVQHSDSSLWDTARDEFEKIEQNNQRLSN